MPEEHTLTVQFDLTAQMVGEGMDIEIANKVGSYQTQVMGGDQLPLHSFPPQKDVNSAVLR